VDTDRLKEEKARGISIELGYAYTPLGGDVLGVIDVPGHENSSAPWPPASPASTPRCW
jgi:selenocysteine-specific translation elongation factor